MKSNSIYRQTLLTALFPSVIISFLLGAYVLHARLDDARNSLIENARLQARSFASASEYALFAGNHDLLSQVARSALSNDDIYSVTVLGNHNNLILMLSKNKNSHRATLDKVSEGAPLAENDDALLVYQAIAPTQLSGSDLELGADELAVPANLGAVILEVSKHRLQNRQMEMLEVSLLVLLGAMLLAYLIAGRVARKLSLPIIAIEDGLRRIGAGSLDVRIETKYKVSELNHLARGINQMASDLQQERNLLETRIIAATRSVYEQKEHVERANLENLTLNAKLQNALNELETIIEANPDILYVINPAGQLVKWNTQLERFSGLTSQLIDSRPMMQFFAKEDHDAALDWINRVIEQGMATIEADLLRFDGARIPYFCNGVVLRDPQGKVIGLTGTGRDITERKLAAERMKRMAHFDTLTGLPNRILLSDRLQLALSSAKRDKTMLGLMFVDLDEFKPINDNYGHHIGDILLKIAASRMLECMRESDTVARIGGDEFLVMLPHIEHREDAMYVAEKIRIALTASFDLQEYEVRISCSVGVAIYPEHGADETTLMRHADMAMYSAKQQGRNGVCLYSVAMADGSALRCDGELFSVAPNDH